MDEAKAEGLMTLDELLAIMDKHAAGSGMEFRESLIKTFPENNPDWAAMRFLLVNMTFADTLAGLGEYRYAVDISHEGRVYKAVLRQNRGMAVTELPESVKDLVWLDQAGIKDLLNNIHPGSGENLPARLGRALPDELQDALESGTMEFMLIDATRKEFMDYRFEIRIRTEPFIIPELGMKMQDFTVQLG